MGTRNVTAVVVDGEIKVAQYCQWDGYLSGQGKIIMDFIKNKMKPRVFKKAVKECKFIDDKAMREKWVEAGDDPNNTSGLIGMDISDKFKELYPALHRDFGGKVLEMIQDGTYSTYDYNEKKTIEHKINPVRELWNDIDFAKDETWCEYAYVLDLDEKVLEIYSGHGEETGKHIKDMSRFAVVPFKDCDPEMIEKLESKEAELAG